MLATVAKSAKNYTRQVQCGNPWIIQLGDAAMQDQDYLAMIHNIRIKAVWRNFGHIYIEDGSNSDFEGKSRDICPCYWKEPHIGNYTWDTFGLRLNDSTATWQVVLAQNEGPGETKIQWMHTLCRASYLNTTKDSWSITWQLVWLISWTWPPWGLLYL